MLTLDPTTIKIYQIYLPTTFSQVEESPSTYKRERLPLYQITLGIWILQKNYHGQNQDNPCNHSYIFIIKSSLGFRKMVKKK